MAINSLNILLIDCNIDEARWLEILVRGENHNVDRVNTSEAALKYLNTKKYNLVFYSSNPKDINTLDFIKIIRELDADVSIIPVYPQIKESESTKDIKDLENEVKNAGAITLMRKPYDIDKIKHWLSVVVDAITLLGSLKTAVIKFFNGK